MSNFAQNVPRVHQFQQAIHRFIQERRDAKLKGADEDAAASGAARYEPSAWLQDAAKRISQIQAVTHVPKAIHPDAKGTALHRSPNELVQHDEIGTHSLSAHYADDVVGNAAALDVNKFLKIEVDGKHLLDWLLADDADAIAALHAEQVTARAMADAFKSLIRTPAGWVSHALAKQVYWWVDGEGSDPADNASYHLLQPMFSSSFAHALHADVQEVRFGEANAVARKARRDGLPHEQPYREYRGLVARSQGGSKPQNISQLTSERGGINYLLASLPPQWDHNQPQSLMGVESCLPRFKYVEAVRDRIDDLVRLLQSNPNPTKETRDAREDIEQALGDELAAYGALQRAQFPPGWTRDANCKLARCEQLWLDSERVALVEDLPDADRSPEDQAFVSEYHLGHWPDEVATRFALWINAHLRKAGLPVGDDEVRHFAKQAVVDASWPVPVQRRAKPGEEGKND